MVDKTLVRQFDVQAPDTAWVTHIKTMVGFAYLAVVIEMLSSRVMGGSLQARRSSEIVLQALMAVGAVATEYGAGP